MQRCRAEIKKIKKSRVDLPLWGTASLSEIRPSFLWHRAETRFKPDTSAPVRTCLRACFHSDTVHGLAWKADGGFCDRLQTQPRRMDVPNYTTAPTGTERQVHVWACACAELSLHCPQPCRYLTFPPSYSLFLCLIPLCFSSLIAQFCFPDLSASASPSLTERTRPPPPSSSCFAGAIIWMTHSFPIT